MSFDAHGNILKKRRYNYGKKNKPYGDNARVGAVRDRVQYFNPQNQKWIKVNIDTGRIMDVKSDGTPFKGVTKKSKSLVLEQLGI